MQPQQIEINPAFVQALLLIKNGENVFITGKAGTGKSTLLSYFRQQTNKAIAVLAPTGVAAINVDGETIHSFFKFKPGTTPSEAHKLGGKIAGTDKVTTYAAIETIIIDEISMTRADLLDAIDAFLRAALQKEASFAGKQLIMIGDLYQLPPVARGEERKALQEVYTTPYFFSAKCIQKLIESNSLQLVELEKVYRQSDPEFIERLNQIRLGDRDTDLLNHINTRVIKPDTHPINDGIYLTSRNDQADATNREELQKLPGAAKVFTAQIAGEFPSSSYPAPEQLELKPAARIMFLNNDPLGRWVNGTLGEILSVNEEEIEVRIAETGFKVHVAPHKWDLSKTIYDHKIKGLSRQSIGSFTQIPMRLAWAITIHKSQGKTFDKVVIDLGRSAFELGQTYVALSRCRSLQGISLVRPLRPGDIRMDHKVSKFLTSFQYRLSNQLQSEEEKTKLINSAIQEKKRLLIVYLKGKNERSERIIRPQRIGMLAFKGIEYPGLEAFCEKAQDMRNFNIERILRVEAVTS